MTTVKNPPNLIAQETDDWCFAAAEAMIRAYYDKLKPMTQYEIAHANLTALADAGDRNPATKALLKEELELAHAMDESMRGNKSFNEKDGAVRKYVGSYRGAIIPEVVHGRFQKPLTPDQVRAQIDANKVFIVGAAIHFYVVYGYEDGGKTLLVRDPWPKGRGGQKTAVKLSEVMGQQGSTAILF